MKFLSLMMEFLSQMERINDLFKAWHAERGNFMLEGKEVHMDNFHFQLFYHSSTYCLIYSAHK